MTDHEMKLQNPWPEALDKRASHFCPGCNHGIIHRLVAEAIDHFGIREKTVAAASVGCSVFLYNYLRVDVVEAPHGRAPAVATGLRRALPDKFVFTYQGDGDLAAIGTAEIIHAANRGEKMTVIFINNGTYGMTGGQMAPTTLLGQVTTTSPYGRDWHQAGYPMRIPEILATMEGPAFVARAAVNKPANLKRARKLIFQAFEAQVKRNGFGFCEVLSACPTDWGLSPQKAMDRVAEEMVPYFPLGVFKERTEEEHL
jgi:2-oxoglutarate/2-oxoacid ferredoxin oxidoreductase subunit beta